jgi:diadenosine tetraphosphate (Ap4A) HIT family hydrolase
MTISKDQCIFCNKTNCKIIDNTNYFFIIRDTTYPVTKHHTLIVSNRHVSNYFELSNDEVIELNKILNNQRKKLQQMDNQITGFNVGVNIGKDAGQSIMHCHIHLIPRRKGDVKDPRGGVRGVIPSKQKYERK